MATTLTDFTSETQLTASEATLVSTNDSERKFIGMFTLTNTSSSNVEVTVWRLSTSTSGTTGSGGNWIWKKTVPANSTITVDKLIGHVLGFSQKISALAGTASVINADMSGTTET